jgi:hypothetical protein
MYGETFYRRHTAQKREYVYICISVIYSENRINNLNDTVCSIENVRMNSGSQPLNDCIRANLRQLREVCPHYKLNINVMYASTLLLSLKEL